jgi:hypothetical protein
MGDFVYAISPGGITATNLTTMEESARLSIPYSNPYEGYYYAEDGVVAEDSSDESDEREEDRPSDSSSDDEDREPRDA